METFFLETERLKLQCVTPAYLHYLYNTLDKAAIMLQLDLDEAGYNWHLRMHEDGIETFRLSMRYFLLIDKSNNQVIGECGFHTWNAAHRRAELFYSLHSDSYKQKGLMKEALNKVLNYAFSEMNLHRVEALVSKTNVPSLKLLQHYGFKFEGTMREDYVVDGNNEDSECYSLLSWEWHQNVLS